ncbi:ScbR family autoregulator-binding transcription factor [Kitasatospora sp. NPDC096147]|uniref:ScbR family autoregulator-binding transcription factor n=1 Tax=Kitasatospora sp. NPDC096147 TaxID=3364093 RepID=UPI0038097482
MAQQERAVQTRRSILLGAAQVFDEYGYDAASIKEILARAQVTKGALYFHFPSKEELARGVLQEQTVYLDIPDNVSKLQELIDLTMAVAHMLPVDPLLRAGLRLAMERGSVDFSESNPLLAWARICGELLEEAKLRGEVLTQVEGKETAEMLVASFAGVQTFSQATTGLSDMEERVSVLWRHLLPTIALPATLVRLDAQPGRGAKVVQQIVG